MEYLVLLHVYCACVSARSGCHTIILTLTLTLIGRPDDQGKFIILNPPGPTIIEDGDKLLFIAEDDDTYRPGEVHPIYIYHIQTWRGASHIYIYTLYIERYIEICKKKQKKKKI